MIYQWSPQEKRLIAVAKDEKPEFDKLGMRLRSAADDAELIGYGFKPENHPRWLTLEMLLDDKPWLKEHRVFGR